jgi:hypothetical protein
MNNQFVDGFRFVTVLGGIVRPLLVATVLTGLWFALRRTTLGRRERIRAWSGIALMLLLWLSAVWLLAFEGFFTPAPDTPAVAAAATIVIPASLGVVIALTLLMRSSSFAAAIDAAPLSWLIGYQVYRTMGFVFLRLWSQGLLPAFFAVPAGIGDMLVGAFALPVALAVRRNTRTSRALGFAFNLFGMADLVNAIGLGVFGTLSSSGGGSQTAVSQLFAYPLVIVPLFGVPLAFIMHCLSTWQLRRRDMLPSTLSVDVVRSMRPTA